MQEGKLKPIVAARAHALLECGGYAGKAVLVTKKGEKMNGSQMMKQEKDVLRWGGLSGMLGSVLLIAAMAIVITMMPPDPATWEEWVTRFADIKTTRILENTVYIMGVIFWVPAFLALYYALRRTNLAFTLFGSVLGILGLAILMVGALPHIGVMPLADIYYAAETTVADKATLGLMWQGSQAIHESSLAVGILVVPIAMLFLSIAMFGSPTFGKGFAAISLLLGIAGTIGAVGNIITLSEIGAIPVFAIIIFNFVVGWKLFSLSKMAGAITQPIESAMPELRTG
ncbi:hypothetical protein [Candidatus Leptofilum sp.]|uniref:hypothetical protein n=1 Tax=Candidatus Leptofilum sp. TaxID=3241576 RepID=UPI003B5CB540